MTVELRRWARRTLDATLCPHFTGRAHGPQPDPELHAHCRRCGTRWPAHDPVTGACPDDFEVPEDFALSAVRNGRFDLSIP